MIRRTLVSLLAIVLLLALYLFFRNPGPTYYSAATLRVGDATVTALIADTETLRARGLSGRTSLSENEAMLFVFPEEGIHSFWMKDMQFPIDIIWIGADEKVVAISYDIKPKTYPETFSSPEPVPYALEVQAGFSKKFGIAPGTVVKGIPSK